MIRRISMLACALCLLSCAGEDLIRNAEVERWCGDSPCDWQVQGDVSRVGTWHPNDYAVSLESDDASLTQENAVVDYRDSDCFSFAMVAKIGAGVDVYLELDFLADGSVEFSQRLPVSDWERRTFKVSAPAWYRKVRFIIRKQGPGRAILAEISAQNANGQCSAPPVELLERPEGALCSDDAVCAGASCAGGRCGGCGNDADCSDGRICALSDSGDERYRICVERAVTPLGTACDRDLQCASGVCDAGACSECASNSDCADGRCQLALQRPSGSRFWPRLCGAGEGERKADDVCTDHRDCQSGECRDFAVSCNVNIVCQRNDDLCLTCSPELQLGSCR